jgi:TM2 domain-containing membrane protein YozV
MHGEFHYPDYRLVDSLEFSQTRYLTNKSPILAAGLSTILPGTGRMYAGRFLDGLMGLWMVLLPGTAAYGSLQQGQSMKGNFFTGITLIFWLGEIYGAYRTVKYYQVPKRRVKSIGI